MPIDPTSAIPLIDPLVKLCGRVFKSVTGKAMDRKARAALAEAMTELLREHPDMARIDALMYGVEASGHKSLELIKAKERYALVQQVRAGRFMASAYKKRPLKAAKASKAVRKKRSPAAKKKFASRRFVVKKA